MKPKTLSRLAAAGCAAVFALSSCVAPWRRPEPSAAAIVLDVPAVAQQEAHDCGLAAIAMLASHHSVEIPEAVRASLRADAERDAGVSGEKIRAALDAAGLATFLIEGRLDRSDAGLYRQIDRGRPVLVELASDEGALHAGLAAGYDPVNGDVMVLDPSAGRVWIRADRFEEAWEDAGRFALVACLPDAIEDAERSDLETLQNAASESLEEQIAGTAITNDTLSTVVLTLAIVVLVVILV